MSTQSTSVKVGPGFGGLLALLFITLKLTGVIAWPWLWVLSPIWIPLVFILAVLGFIGLVAGAVLTVRRVRR